MDDQCHVEVARNGFGRPGAAGGVFSKDPSKRFILGSWLNDVAFVPKSRMVRGYVSDIRENEYPMAQILLIDSIRIRDCLPAILVQYPKKVVNASYRHLFKEHPARKVGFGNVFLEIRFDELGVFFRILRESTGQIEESGINLGIVPKFQFEVFRIQIPEDSSGRRHFLVHDGFQRNFDFFDRVESQEPKLSIEHVNIQNLFERGVQKKAVVRLLERLEITAQSEISYVFQISPRLVGIPDFESPVRE